nr:hypothetical protein [Haliscomenobacter sp.]
MKTSFLLGISMLVFSLAFGASGIYDNNIALKINGSNTNYYYGSHCTNNLGGCVGSASPISPNFESSILSNVLTLSIDWLEVRTYKNGSDDITGANLYYRVFQTGHIPGSFFQESISFGADIGGGDQRWTENVTINLITGLLASTNYKLEIYSTAPFTYSGGS